MIFLIIAMASLLSSISLLIKAEREAYQLRDRAQIWITTIISYAQRPEGQSLTEVFDRVMQHVRAMGAWDSSLFHAINALLSNNLEVIRNIIAVSSALLYRFVMIVVVFIIARLFCLYHVDGIRSVTSVLLWSDRLEAVCLVFFSIAVLISGFVLKLRTGAYLTFARNSLLSLLEALCLNRFSDTLMRAPDFAPIPKMRRDQLRLGIDLSQSRYLLFLEYDRRRCEQSKAQFQRLREMFTFVELSVGVFFLGVLWCAL